MSGQKRGKPLQKRSLQNLFRETGESIKQLVQNLLMRFFRSLMALLVTPVSLLQAITGRGKQSSSNFFAPGQFRFSLKLSRLWRSLPLFDRKHALSSAGFVLPTIAILLLIMSLVISSLLFRSVTRTTEVIGERNQQVIYNAATPAIDRAKAKLEYLFRQDPRMPGGLPSDAMLESMLRNDGLNGVSQLDEDNNSTNGIQNPYNLPNETRLDLNEDNIADNAWSFQLDTNGDGKLETVAYSILVRTISTDGLTNRTNSDSDKASKLVIRNAPINSSPNNSLSGCQGVFSSPLVSGQDPNQGWDAVTSATVRRAFQVTAVVIDGDNTASRTVATLEMQQDRQADRGNKWGAWFRNDLELFPGPDFRWNGAIHTEGNLMLSRGATNGSNLVRFYLISAPNSCLYTRDASEITMSGEPNKIPPYQGQMFVGSMKWNQFYGDTRFDLYKPGGVTQNIQINTTNHSVNTTGITPSDLSLDPVVLLTTNQNKNRRTNPSQQKNEGVRATNWASNSVVTEGRLLNKPARAPYVDDTYRADNRYGPKPEYNDRIKPFIKDDGTPTGTKAGNPILSSDPNYDTLTNLSTTNPEGIGLDGYWERRAWAEGLRVIVGQRLELGNAYGWKGNNDPLYPPTVAATTRAHEQRQWKTLRDNLAAVQATAVYHSAGANRNFPIACLATTAHPGTQTTIRNSTIFNTLSINGSSRVIADFLGMLPNEDLNNNGTLDSGEDINGNGILDRPGLGTNGWEFNPPKANETDFTSALASGQPLRIALENLAHFAGDGAPDGSDFTVNNPSPHFGAFPPRQDTSSSQAVPSVGQQVHPYSNLAMWGDFSNLRRVIQLLNSGTTYANLSLADKTTLQTASCTLGMLAYNLQTVEEAYKEVNGTNGMNALGVQLSQYMDGNLANGEIGRPSDGSNLCTNANKSTCTDPPVTSVTNNAADYALNAKNYYSQFTAREWINALLNDNSLGGNKAGLIDTAQKIQLRQQIQRDRASGFRADNVLFGNGTGYDPILGEYIVQGVNSGSIAPGQTFKIACDPNQFSTSGGNAERAKLGLSLAFCSSSETVKYPSLFYLFPLTSHDHNGTATATAEATIKAIKSTATANVIQPSAEPYVDDRYIFNTAATDDVNGNYTYRVIKDSNSNGIEDPAEDSIGEIAIQPRTRANWQLPNTTTTTNRVNIIRDGTTAVAVTFLDKGIFNGREMMSVRVLDFDLDLLRRNTITTGEYWLPNTGIVYAFREDAMREDGIARPAATTTWASCDTAAEITGSSCRMNAVAASPVDPPVNPDTGISPKPVDFYADPDRRPYGFRLRNGAYLRRPAGNTGPFLPKGLAFISDNPVYIQADRCAFNLHSSSENSSLACNNIDNNRLEEFSTTLNNNWDNFYTRGDEPNKTSEQPSSTFARDSDTWRPAEIIADGISILSDSFVDGSMAEGIRRRDVGSRSSYRTLNAPTDGNPDNNDSGTRRWIREDGSYSDDKNAAVPIKISRDGFPLYCVVNSTGADVTSNNTNPNACTGVNREQPYGREVGTNANGGNNRTYLAFTDGKPTIGVANDARVNATIVSALIPSRAGQSYGGMHNFPRFLENWSGRNLNISGAFIQLNFSTSATGPFDQDSWEPGNNADANSEPINYYGAPGRRWGYDVGLQYAPAGPIASRFVTPSNTRSEFYRELPLDDPYICRLRRARKQTGTSSWSSAGIDPQAPSSCS